MWGPAGYDSGAGRPSGRESSELEAQTTQKMWDSAGSIFTAHLQYSCLMPHATHLSEQIFAERTCFENLCIFSNVPTSMYREEGDVTRQ